MGFQVSNNANLTFLLAGYKMNTLQVFAMPTKIKIQKFEISNLFLLPYIG
mgnify:CR=1 FL=1